jgi:hypothetical protein
VFYFSHITRRATQRRGGAAVLVVNVGMVRMLVVSVARAGGHGVVEDGVHRVSVVSKVLSLSTFVDFSFVRCSCCA